MSSTDKKFNIVCDGIRLTSKYNYFIFPFGSSELLSELAKLKVGYTLGAPPRAGKVPIGAKLDWNGPVAKKNNVTIEFDSLVQVIGAEGKIPHDITSVFAEIIEIAKSNLGLNLEENTRFFEVNFNYSVETGKNPLTVLSKIKPEGELFDSLKEILHANVSTYALHFCNKNETVETADWFDIRIQPIAPRSTSLFDVLGIYRNKDLSKIVKFTNDIESSITKIFGNLD